MSDFMAAAADALERQVRDEEAGARLLATVRSLDVNNPDDLATLHHILRRVRAGIRLLESKGAAT